MSPRPAPSCRSVSQWSTAHADGPVASSNIFNITPSAADSVVGEDGVSGRGDASDAGFFFLDGIVPVHATTRNLPRCSVRREVTSLSEIQMHACRLIQFTIIIPSLALHHAASLFLPFSLPFLPLLSILALSLSHIL